MLVDPELVLTLRSLIAKATLESGSNTVKEMDEVKSNSSVSVLRFNLELGLSTPRSMVKLEVELRLCLSRLHSNIKCVFRSLHHAGIQNTFNP